MIYLKLFRQRFHSHITDWKGLLEEYMEIFLNIAMYMSVYYWAYEPNRMLADTTLEQMFTYLVIVTLCLYISRINGKKLAQRVSRGRFAYELLLPYSYPLKAVAEAAADCLRGVLTTLLPIILILVISGHLVLPSGIGYGLLAVISLFLGVLLRWGIQMVLQMFGFWYRNMVNVFFIMRTVFLVFCGGILPYWFLPKGLVRFLMCTPFGYIWVLPMDIYFGRISIEEALWGMLVQIVWITVSVLLVKKLFAMGRRSIQAAE